MWPTSCRTPTCAPTPPGTGGERLGSGRITAALRALPDVQRIAITLMDVCGFTAAQVAAITGAPRGTVLARVHRGRKTLALTVRDERETTHSSEVHE